MRPQTRVTAPRAPGAKKLEVLKQGREAAKFNSFSDFTQLTLGPLHGHIGEVPNPGGEGTARRPAGPWGKC
jgi:hypothetical protein